MPYTEDASRPSTLSACSGVRASGRRPGEAKRLARKGKARAVLRSPARRARPLKGPAPLDDAGCRWRPPTPGATTTLWWLDRMVRSNQPLVERMTLVWHDWFATAASARRLNIEQNQLFRRLGLGSFEEAAARGDQGPGDAGLALGHRNTKWSPNENYARELMELFTLGACRLHASTTSASRRGR